MVEQTQNKTKHRKLTLEKNILLLFLPGIKPVIITSPVLYLLSYPHSLLMAPNVNLCL